MRRSHLPRQKQLRSFRVNSKAVLALFLFAKHRIFDDFFNRLVYGIQLICVKALIESSKRSSQKES